MMLQKTSRGLLTLYILWLKINNRTFLRLVLLVLNHSLRNKDHCPALKQGWQSFIKKVKGVSNFCESQLMLSNFNSYGITSYVLVLGRLTAARKLTAVKPNQAAASTTFTMQYFSIRTVRVPM